MTDYSKLTDKQINLLVSQRLGWRVNEMVVRPNGSKGYASADWSGYPDAATWPRVWHLDAPQFTGDDYYHYEPGKDFESPEDAWDHLARNADYATLIDAAAALDFGEHAVVMIERRRGYNWVEVQGQEVGAFHDNLARAISEAWLAYMDVIGEGAK